MTRAFVQACQENGIPYSHDFNGETQAGCGVYQTTTKDYRRCSAAVGYLKPVLHRKNLTVETGCTVLQHHHVNPAAPPASNMPRARKSRQSAPKAKCW